ncbi:MAG: flagellar hook-basal body complex protein [Spongiibacteraceae bacterium]|nr:flagellar hook-basal body complex protein [Spongiibacteraceae bacterium]
MNTISQLSKPLLPELSAVGTRSTGVCVRRILHFTIVCFVFVLSPFLLTGCVVDENGVSVVLRSPVTISVDGQGYLVASDQGNRVYLRSGRWRLISNGRLISDRGYVLLGYQATNGVIDTGVLADIRFLLLRDGASIVIREDGIVLSLINGQQTIYGQVALANFDSSVRLIETEPGVWIKSVESGEETVGGPGRGVFNLLKVNEAFESELDATLQLSAKGDNYLVLHNGEQRIFAKQDLFFSDWQHRVVNDNDLQLTGYLPDQKIADNAAKTIQTLIPLLMEPSKIPADITTAVTLTLNLNATDKTVIEVAFNPDDKKTYHFSASVTVYDNQGNDHLLVFYFVHLQADNGLELYYRYGESQVGGAYSIEFDDEGLISNEFVVLQSRVLDPGTGALYQSIDFDIRGVTQLAADYKVDAIAINGQSPQWLKGVNVNNCGEFIGHYAPAGINVITQTVAVARFANPSALIDLGGGYFAESEASGVPQMGVPCSAGFDHLDGDSMD